MFAVDKLSKLLAELIEQRKYAEAIEVHKQLGEVLETYKWSC